MITNEAQKRCPKCKRIKHDSEFYRSKSTKDGLTGWCRDCIIQNQRQYDKEHQADRHQYDKQYRREHRPQFQQYNKQYRKTLRGHLQQLWHNILHRCNSPKDKKYNYYGGRGIQVKFASFDDFYDYIVNILKADPRGLTIDRINNDGHYERGNIRFVSRAENNRNKRRRKVS